MKKYIVALDQGTTSSRCVVFNQKVEKIASAQREFPQHFPKPGWVEHDPEDIFTSQLSVLKEAVMKADISSEQIEAIGITNQRETVIIWEKDTGRPIYNAIVWQCRRTSNLADKLIADGKGEMIRAKTGLLPDAYFSGTKIKWILDNVPGARARAEKGELLAGTVDTWLIWRLSGGKAHVTDYTNACRTMLFNIHSLEWDQELLDLLNIPRCILPEVRDSSCIYTTTDKKVCGFEVPIASAIGDQQAALFGQGCFEKGETKTTYGTGCFLLMNTGDRPVDSKHKLLTTIALGMNGKVEYALEGSVFIGGALIKWLRDQLGIINTANDVNILAESVPDSNGVIIVPAFTGLGAPYWDSYARGTIVGLTRGASKAHICRAALEAIAFQVKDELECMKEDSGIDLPTLKVDGGASVSNLMMQFQADILNTTVYRPENTETTVTGAAFLAGLATGYWKSKAEIKKVWKIDKVFIPSMKENDRSNRYAQWQRAIERSREWDKE
ncbi:MAG: glycerol kinase GlpK [Treponema sp.]|nr:glycerol kinase GlpK [Treponema sp.]